MVVINLNKIRYIKNKGINTSYYKHSNRLICEYDGTGNNRNRPLDIQSDHLVNYKSWLPRFHVKDCFSNGGKRSTDY